MTDPVLLIVDALAIFRISRLIVADSIFDTPRLWLLRRWPGAETEFLASEITLDDSSYWMGSNLMARISNDDRDDTWVAVKPRWFGTWLDCIWCVSVWVAVAVVALRYWWAWWQWPALVAAGSAAAGWINSSTE